MSTEVREIREKTLLMYFLLVGSFSISDKRLSDFKGDVDDYHPYVIESIYSHFCTWIEPKMRASKDDNSTIVFHLIKQELQDCVYNLYFTECHDFDISKILSMKEPAGEYCHLQTKWVTIASDGQVKDTVERVICRYRDELNERALNNNHRFILVHNGLCRDLSSR